MNSWGELLLDGVLTKGEDIVGEKISNILLETILGIQSEEIELIKKIDQKIQNLSEGPFYTGIEYFKEATCPNRDLDKQIYFIEKAKEKFMDAYGIFQGDKFWVSLTTFHIALCWLALNEIEDARKRFFESYNALVDYMKGITVETELPKIANNLFGIMLIAAPTLGIANVVFWVRAENRARKKLTALYDFLITLRKICLSLKIEKDLLKQYAIYKRAESGPTNDEIYLYEVENEEWMPGEEIRIEKYITGSHVIRWSPD